MTNKYQSDWRLIPLVFIGHDVVCTSAIDGLPLYYLLVMMLSVLLPLTAYPLGIVWSWCCLYFFDWRLTPLVFIGHDVVCTWGTDNIMTKRYQRGKPLIEEVQTTSWPKDTKGVSRQSQKRLVMMLSVPLLLTPYPFGIFLSWCCLYFFDWRLTPLVSFGHDVVCTSAIDGLPL
jgi:hypothetical protein